MKICSKDVQIVVVLLGTILSCHSSAESIKDEKQDEVSIDDFTEGDDEFPVVTNTTILEAINTTQHRGFLHGFG